MEINKEFLKKAKKVNARQDYIDECVKAEICPRCGAKLKVDPYANDGHGGSKTRVWCITPKCYFRISIY